MRASQAPRFSVEYSHLLLPERLPAGTFPRLHILRQRVRDRLSAKVQQDQREPGKLPGRRESKGMSADPAIGRVDLPVVAIHKRQVRVLQGNGTLSLC